MRRNLAPIAAVAALAALTAGCTTSQAHLTEGYGEAVRQSVIAQVADPDARYKGDVDPASNGPRTDLAQTRYEKGEVIKPVATRTSDITSTGGGGSGGSGGGR